MELNRIYNENCLETMTRMPGGFIDLTVTSPPYDDLRDYNGYHFPFKSIVRELYHVTKDGGVVVWIVCDKTVDGDETGTSFRQALYFKEVGFKLADTEIYAKENPIPGDQGKRYQQSFEYMFCFSKGRPKTFNPLKVKTSTPGRATRQFRLETGGRNDNTGRSMIVTQEEKRATNIFFYTIGQGIAGHPAPFPLQLAADQIKTWSNPDDLVYDCFMGSGTTAKAAHQLKRRWIGSEISSEYVELANKRLEPYLMQEQLF